MTSQTPEVEKCCVEIPVYEDDGVTLKDSDYWFMCSRNRPCPLHDPVPSEGEKRIEEMVDLVKEYARQYYLTAEENDSEYALKAKEEEIRQALQAQQQKHQEEKIALVGEIESKRKLETWTVMTTPVVDEKAVAYNQGLDQAIAIFTRTLRGE